jgi:Uma2 family endonuclease
MVQCSANADAPRQEIRFGFAPSFATMMTMAADAAYRLMGAAEFLEIDFGHDRKAELDGGLIRMMAGGTIAHARVQGNVFAFLRNALRGTPCRPYGSDAALETGMQSVRYPDVTVVCKEQQAKASARSFRQANVVFEVLSDTTAAYDQSVKLNEYKTLTEMQTIVFLDPERETVRIVQRLGPSAWRDELFEKPTDVPLPSLEVVVPAAELFALD